MRMLAASGAPSRPATRTREGITQRREALYAHEAREDEYLADEETASPDRHPGAGRRVSRRGGRRRPLVGGTGGDRADGGGPGEGRAQLAEHHQAVFREHD